METRRFENAGDSKATRILPLEEETPLLPDGPQAVGMAGDGVAIQTGALGRRLAVSTAIVGGAFVVSRVLGLVREAVIARQFGATGQLDTYIAAFRLPDTLFLIIVGGAVGSAFIPVFTGLMSRGHVAQAWHLASTLI